jgi:hypothetical protein
VLVDLGTQRAIRMRHVVICGLPGSTVFSTLSHKCYDFRKEVSNTKSVFRFSLQLLSETLLILNIIERDMIKMHTVPRVKYPLFLSDLNQTENFLNRFPKNS